MQRAEMLLEAINDGELSARASLLTRSVRFTSFDRGQIHEAQGREEVCESLDRLSANAASRFVARGSRIEDDAVFFWGGSSDESGPGWMITMFFHRKRFSDIRIYLMR